MELGLTSRGALLLASSQGLGLGIAHALADEGANVVLTGRDADKLRTAADQINSKGMGKAHWIQVDLASFDAAAVYQQAVEKLGAVDILLANSGGPAPSAPSAVAAETWRSEFEKMVLPVFELTRIAVAPMRERKWGRIIAVTSSGVVQPIPHLGVSNALRSSLVGWLKTLAGEVAPDGVTVNVVAPGRIATARTQQLDAAAAARTGRSVEDVHAESAAQIPMRRYGTVEEFASVVTFLASERASYMTGSVVRVDGGMIKSV